MASTTKRTFVRRRPQQSGDMSLQITSMADVFTILLIFLLKNAAVGSAALAPSAGVTLPAALASGQADEALKLELSETAVTVDGKPVVTLAGFHGSDEAAWSPLERELDFQRRRQEEIAKLNPDVKSDARVILVADSRAPYESVKRVLAVAASKGFTDLKLAVVAKDH